MIDMFGSQKVWTNIRKGGDWWADVVHAYSEDVEAEGI